MLAGGNVAPPNVTLNGAARVAAAPGITPRPKAAVVNPQPVPKASMTSPGLAGTNVAPGSNPGAPTRADVTALIAAIAFCPSGLGRKEKNSGEAVCITTPDRLLVTASDWPQLSVTCTLTGPGESEGTCTLICPG